MRIAAGELDRRIELWRVPLVDDGTAKAKGAAVKLANRCARKIDVSDGERVRAAEYGMEVTARFLVRSDDVTRTIVGREILVYRGRTYEVTGVKESDERDDGIELTTAWRPDAFS